MSERQSHPAGLVTPRFLDPLPAPLIHRVRVEPERCLSDAFPGGRKDRGLSLLSGPGQITIKKLSY